jgi:hypothetical protein
MFRQRHFLRTAEQLPGQTHSAVLQNLVGQGVHRRVGISGVEFGDDHHPLPPIFFLALPTVLGSLSREAWSGEEP